MRTLILTTTLLAMAPWLAQAATDEGVYAPAPGQETYLGSTQPTATTSYTPTDTTAEAPRQDLQALSPASVGEHNPAATSVNDEILAEHTVGNITYVTGGIGEAERKALDGLRAKYNLRVTNAQKNGAFVGDTVISLMDSKGTQLLSTEVDPLFFASIPAGKYTVKAVRDGQTKTQAVTVGAKKSAQISFTWM